MSVKSCNALFLAVIALVVTLSVLIVLQPNLGQAFAMSGSDDSVSGAVASSVAAPSAGGSNGVASAQDVAAPGAGGSDGVAAGSIAGSIAGQASPTSPDGKTSAELSDDGVDYGWLYRKGDYLFDLNDAPSEENALLAFYGGRAYHIGTFRNKDHLMREQLSHYYDDGTLVFQYGNQVRLESIINGDRSQLERSWLFYSMAPGAILWNPDDPCRVSFLAQTEPKEEVLRTNIHHVIFDETVLNSWGVGLPGAPETAPQSVAPVVYLDNLFQGFSGVTQIDGLEYLYTGGVQNMAGMFSGCSNLQNIDISGFDTSQCQDFSGMFDGCSSLLSLVTGEGWTQSGVDNANLQAAESQAVGAQSVGTQAAESQAVGAQSAGTQAAESQAVENGEALHANALSQKATFPVDMKCVDETGKTHYFTAGQVIPDGAAEYTSTSHISVRETNVLLADPSSSGVPFKPTITCEYTGSEIRPLVQVTYDGATLVQGQDYTVDYLDNVEDGTARVRLTGIHEFYGTATCDFTIVDSAAYAYLFNDGTLVLKANHHVPTDAAKPEGEGLVMSKRWLDASTASPGASVPWAGRASKITKVVVDPSFSTFPLSTLENWFAGCSALKSVTGLRYLNTQSAVSMSGMFSGCTALEALPAFGFDMSHVRSARGLFQGCASLASVSLQGVELPQVQDVGNAFSGCTSLTSVSLAKSSLPQARNLSSMFAGCTSLANVSLQELSLPQVQNLSNAFAGCTALKSASVRDLTPGGACNLSGFFSGCKSLATVELSGLTAPSAQNLSGFFNGCAALSSATFTNLSFAKATDFSNFFRGCSSLVNLDISGLTAPHASNVSGFLAGCSQLETLALGGLASAGKANMSALLTGCPNLKTLKCSSTWRNATSDQSRLKFAARAYRTNPSYKRHETGTAVPAGAGEYRLRDLALQFAQVVMSKPKYTCTGKPLKPPVKVMLGDVQLQKGTDYTLKYENNVYPGKAKITIRGKGTLTGGLVVPFQVVARTTKVGDRLVYETKNVKFTLKVTSVKKKGGQVRSATASLVKATVKSGSLKTMTIPDSCTIGGVTVSITEVTSKLVGQFGNVRNVYIGANVVKIGVRAFAKAPKVKKLFVKSARLKSVKNCLKGSKVRNVETRVYLSKSRRATYKTWFTRKSGKSGVKFIYGLYFKIV